ncbi:hypothetical protein [Acutalibacter sp. 1XD8-36]|uniref:hypothetical protein n=1 Tax=Acutalibacter sp. 1XD8-36 TaxID=2320852 RepID=UPI0014123643|nr:hypothetical protein [Acutalibacter sp. 1XD8-36]NBJ88437.1 hypothetical protein [Acutalibacter sp. 1XD8-36]
MKIYPSFRLQLRDHIPAVIIYYIVLISMALLSLALIPFMTPDDNVHVTTNGVTAVTIIFAFICSLCAFKDSFFLSIQHSVSRRTQFIARLGTLGAVCAVLALGDELYTLMLTGLGRLFPTVFSGESLYQMIYSYDGMSPKGSVFDIIFSFFSFLAVSSLGYLLTVLNYRLNKIGKVLFWAGTPIAVVLIASYISAHPSVAGIIIPFLTGLIWALFSSLPRMIISCTLLTVVFSGLTWLLMRRAGVK